MVLNAIAEEQRKSSLGGEKRSYFKATFIHPTPPKSSHHPSHLSKNPNRGKWRCNKCLKFFNKKKKAYYTRSGKLCDDCYAFWFCDGIGCTESGRTSCDYWPNRFRPIQKEFQQKSCDHNWDYHPISKKSRTCRKCGQFELYCKWL